MPGLFIISLDFELHWGVRDHTTVNGYRENLLGARKAVPEMLSLFSQREIAATWATVGFLFAETKKQLEAHIPDLLPSYTNREMSPYDALGEVGVDEEHDPFHFAPSLIRQIAKTARQELGTHTFSHYYCLENGQTAEQFDADLAATERISSEYGNTCNSLVFPRNQVAPEYLDILRRRGVCAYRSNGKHWAYQAADRETNQRRLYRLADAYVPLSGSRAHSLKGSPLVDVAASAFLRPWSRSLRHLERVRFRRLAEEMTAAAARDETFHLWWHPHNFGMNLRENLAFLSALLDVFVTLRRRYGMESVTMAEAARVAPT